MKTFYILAPFDPIPGEGGYPARFASLKLALEAAGHRCIWWTSSWNHAVKTERQNSASADDIRLLPVPGYIKNVGYARFRNHRALARVYINEVKRAVDQGILPPPDLQLIALPPLETPNAAFSLRSTYGGKVVIDLMDTWPDTFFQVLPFPSHKLRAIVGGLLFAPYRRMLRRALEQCDAVSAQSHTFMRWAHVNGLKDKPSHVCYLGSDLPKKKLIRSFKSGDTLRLAYMGSMGKSYDLETVLHAVHILVHRGSSVHLDLAGAGQKETVMRDYVKRHGLKPFVTFHGYLPKVDAFSILEECHIGLVPMFPESGVAMPYKACDYAGRGLPLLHSLRGELREMVKSLDAGTEYKVGDADSLVCAISGYYDAPDKISSQSQASFKLARQHFDRSISYPEMSAYLESLLSDLA